MLQVKLPDGSTRDYSHSVSPLDVAQEIGPRLARDSIAASVDGQVVGLDHPLPENGSVALELLTNKDDRALAVLPRRYHLVGQLPLLLVMIAYTFGGLYLLFGG